MSLRRRFIWGVLLSALVASWAYYAEYLPLRGNGSHPTAWSNTPRSSIPRGGMAR